MFRIGMIALTVAIIATLYLVKLQKGTKDETPELRRLIFLKSAQWKVKPALIRAIIKVESNFDPRARNPRDPSYGLMQITPGLAADFGIIPDGLKSSRAEIEQIYVQENNLDVGCWYLAKLLNKYNFSEAVQMYNVGESGFNKGTRNYKYLDKVRKYYEKYGG